MLVTRVCERPATLTATPPDGLARGPRVAELVAGLVASGREPDAPVAPGGWSAREVVLHLAAVDEEVWHPRLDALVRDDFPQWAWVEPGPWAGPGVDRFDGALAAFAERRAVTVARLDALDDAGWSKVGRHETFGLLDVAALLRIALDHDAEHLAQIGG